MNQMISVIVPVYNVEAYLPACLDSLLGQTYQNLEILVVDDGSTDRSGQICDEYAGADARIHVIHQENGGAACAKNTALRAATGDYLTFADSDDYVETDAYGHMMELMERHQADIVQGAHRYVYRGKQEEAVWYPEIREKSAEEFLVQFLSDWTCGLLWNKLYKRELFDGVFFEEGHKIDDEYFTYQGVMQAGKIVYTPQIVYNYRMRKSSVMGSESSMEQIVLDRLDVLQKRREKVIASYPQVKKMYDEHYANSLIILLKDGYLTERSALQAKKQLGEFLAEKPAPLLEQRSKVQLYLARYRSMKKTLANRNERRKDPDFSLYFD